MISSSINILWMLPLFMHLFMCNWKCVLCDVSGLEDSLIQKAVNYHRTHLFDPQKDLLCVVIIGDSKKSIDILEQNIQRMNDKCDWAIVGYQSPLDVFDLCYLDDLGTRVRHCNVSSNNLEMRSLNSVSSRLKRSMAINLAKISLFSEVSAISREYRRVLVLDEDLSLLKFDVDLFLNSWSCAITPPPLLVSPLIDQINGEAIVSTESQLFQKSVASVAAVRYVSQQAPAFDSRFFQWLTDNILERTKHVGKYYGVDEGIDKIWCRAAEIFGVSVLGYEPQYIGCGLINAPIIHLNFLSIKLKWGNSAKYKFYSEKSNQAYNQLFPKWFENFKTNKVNPPVFIASSTCLEKVQSVRDETEATLAKLRQNCLPFCGKMHGTNEARMIKEGIKAYKLFQPPTKELLCVVFYGGSNSSKDLLIENVIHMNDKCDWAIIGYKSFKKSICEHPSFKSNLRLCIVSGYNLEQRSNYGREMKMKRSKTLNIPKSLLYSEVSELAKTYKRIFLMDEDISLIPLKVDLFIRAWACSKTPPPLIVQSIVQQPTSGHYVFPFLDDKSWISSKSVVLASISFVEQQVPAFDSRFFVWYTDYVINSTKHIGLNWGVDWGYDRMWCEAARMYGIYVLGYDSKKYKSACGLITTTRVKHSDLKTIMLKTGSKNKFGEYGRNSAGEYRLLYPHWFPGEALPKILKNYSDISGNCKTDLI